MQDFEEPTFTTHNPQPYSMACERTTQWPKHSIITPAGTAGFEKSRPENRHTRTAQRTAVRRTWSTRIHPHPPAHGMVEGCVTHADERLSEYTWHLFTEQCLQ